MYYELYIFFEIFSFLSANKNINDNYKRTRANIMPYFAVSVLYIYYEFPSHTQSIIKCKTLDRHS